MKKFIITSLLFSATLIAVFALASKPETLTPIEITKKPPVQISKPKVDLVFALDTTGSMSGLINAAKEKIWSIASTMSQAQPAPEIRIGLVAYRDRGDEYVTKVIDLSADLDSVYAALLDFKAAGGGDSPESVNEALYQAVNAISWSQDPKAYQVIFLVGDAPGHHEYADDVSYKHSLEQARQKGIIVNAIQAGQNSATTKEWNQIAALGQGATFQVEQGGSSLAVKTPFDQQIAKASQKLDSTRLYYGSKAEQSKRAHKKAAAEKLYAESSVASQARRAKFNMSASNRHQQLKEKELLQALEDKAIELDEIAEEELPQSLQAVGSRIRKEMVEERLAKRKVLKSELASLTEKRDAYIKEKVAKEKAKSSLDGKLYKTLKAQAGDKGLVYDAESNDY